MRLGLPFPLPEQKKKIKNIRNVHQDEIGPHNKTGRFLSKAEILGVGVFSPLSSIGDGSRSIFFGTFFPRHPVLDLSAPRHRNRNR